MQPNLFHTMLTALSVPHTDRYVAERFETHPYKYTLYGIGRLLEAYRVDTLAVRVDDKDKLGTLPVPFLAQVSDDIVVVKRTDGDEVAYDWYGEEIRVSTTRFRELWSGVVLLAGLREDSGEPDYRRHLRSVRLHRAKQTALGISLAALLLLGFCAAPAGAARAVQLLTAGLSLCGLYTGYLLLQQLHIQGTTADRLCNLLKKGSCNNVLETAAARPFGLFSWSEIGFSYFAVNAACTLLFPDLLPVLAFAALCALPVTGWSLWYQKFRAGAWCPLCLLTVLVIWLQATVHLVGGSYALPLPPATATAGAVGAWAGTLLALNLALPVVTRARKAERWQYAYAHLKSRQEVLNALLGEEPLLPTDETASQLIFGPAGAKHRLTVFSNPFCNPCAEMHRRLGPLLQAGYEVQYVLTYFTENLKGANRDLIACYLHEGRDKAWTHFSAWFDGGKAKGAAFFSFLPRPAAPTDEVDREMERHEAWTRTARFTATPTVLLDGRKLPAAYSVEDLLNL